MFTDNQDASACKGGPVCPMCGFVLFHQLQLLITERCIHAVLTLQIPSAVTCCREKERRAFGELSFRSRHERCNMVDSKSL